MATPDSLVADAVLAAQRGDWPALDALCASHPDHSTVIRARLARLGRLGLVEFNGSLPDRVGPYRIVERLGQGGMGEVYRAEQDTPVRRQVAIKVVRAGTGSRAVRERFVFERQTLARLQHPHIAQLYDAGETGEGDPFFAMELIEGADLVAFCDGATFDLRRRVELMATVCDAVQHAHRKGVVHRDLKPTNILVRWVSDHGEAAPAIIDFGVAKLLAPDLAAPDQTADYTILGTPSYMSPEQARGDVRLLDTRTDVYSLGVVLYELLTGELPHDPLLLAQSAPGDLGALLSVAPARPSTRGSGSAAVVRGQPTIAGLRKALRGDLDLVVLRSLELEPDRRYASAGELAAELRRILAHEPVLAAPPSARYRLRKLAERHRAAFVATLIVLFALVAATIVSVRFGLAEAEQRRLADLAGTAEHDERLKVEARERELAAVAQFQAEMLAGIDVELMGSRLRDDLLTEARAALVRARLGDDAVAEQLATLGTLLDGVNFTNPAVHSLDRNVLAPAVAAIDRQFGDQPSVRAALLQTVAKTYRELALYPPAIEPQNEALRLRQATLGFDDPLTLTSLVELAILEDDRGERENALDRYRDALERRERVLGPDHPDTLSTRNNLALVLHDSGEQQFAEAELRDVLARRERILGPDHPDTLTTIANLGYVLEDQGREAEAEHFTRLALDKRRALLGADDPSTLTTLGNLAAQLRVLGRLDEAEAGHREALEGRRRAFGDEHPDTLLSLTGLAAVLAARGRLADAEPLLREALATSQRVFGPLHERTLLAMSDLAGVYMNQGRLAEAEPMAREVLDRYRKEYGDEHLFTITAIGNAGALLRAMGRPAEAEPFMREALELSTRVLGETHRITVIATYNLGTVLKLQGKAEEAEPLLRTTIERADEALGPDHPYVLAGLHALAGLLLEQGRLDDAAPVIAEALERHQRALGATHRRTSTVRILQARLLIAQGDDAAAETVCREVLAVQQQDLGETHPDALATMVVLGSLLARRGPIEEAESLLRETVTASRASIGAEHPTALDAYSELLDLLARTERFEVAAPLALEAAEAALARSDARGRDLLARAVKCLDARHVDDPTAADDPTAEDLRRRAAERGWTLDAKRDR